MRHLIPLSASILNGYVDEEVMASTLMEREQWVPPLTPNGERLLARLTTAVEHSDPLIMWRLREQHEAVATLFGLLPADRLLSFFAAVENAEGGGQVLSGAQRAANKGQLAERIHGVPVRTLFMARVGFLTAVLALTRIIDRVRSVSRRGMNMGGSL